MRFIKLPYCWLEEDNEVYTTDLRFHPFSVDAYHASILDYMEEGVPMSQDITKIITKSGISYELMIEISEFEALMDKYMSQ